MATPSGLSAQLGAVAETTYGTPVAVSRFWELQKEELKKDKNTMQGGGMAAGRFARLGSRRVVTSEAADGSFDVEIATKGFGLLLNHIFGGTAVVTQQAATMAYLQTHAIADNFGKSLTIQAGVPDLGGVVRPKTIRGAKITSAEFTCKTDETLMCSVEVDGQKYSELETLASASYPTPVTPFHWRDMSVLIGATSGSEASVSGIKGMSMKIERPQADDRYYAGAAGLKAEPVMNDYVNVTGSIDSDYLDKTILADRYHADTQFSLIWRFQSSLLAAAGYPFTFQLQTPATFLDGDSPTVDGPGVTSGSFPFSAQLDGTNPLVTCLYTSTDTAI